MPHSLHLFCFECIKIYKKIDVAFKTNIDEDSVKSHDTKKKAVNERRVSHSQRTEGRMTVPISGGIRRMSPKSLLSSCAAFALSFCLHVADIAAAEKAYVVNNGSDSVTSVNAETNTVIATHIPVGPSPRGLGFSKDGKHAFVLNNGSNTVTAIDTVTDQVISTITVGNMPEDIIVTQSKIFISNRGSNSVSVIDPKSLLVTATLSVGTEPGAMALSDDGKFLMVTNQGSNNVTVINVCNCTPVTSYGVGESPVNIGIVPGIQPPSSPCGFQVKDGCYVTNIVRWGAPCSGPKPCSYRIYRDKCRCKLAGVVYAHCGCLEFIDTPCESERGCKYYLVSVDERSRESRTVVVYVKEKSCGDNSCCDRGHGRCCGAIEPAVGGVEEEQNLQAASCCDHHDCCDEEDDDDCDSCEEEQCCDHSRHRDHDEQSHSEYGYDHGHDSCYRDPCHRDPCHKDPCHKDPCHRDPCHRDPCHRDPCHHDHCRDPYAEYKDYIPRYYEFCKEYYKDYYNFYLNYYKTTNQCDPCKKDVCCDNDEKGSHHAYDHSKHQNEYKDYSCKQFYGNDCDKKKSVNQKRCCEDRPRRDRCRRNSCCH